MMGKLGAVLLLAVTVLAAGVASGIEPPAVL
jgi:hypothetical protein